MPKAGHREDGTFDGTLPNRTGGRKPLPWFLLNSHGDASWAMVIACAAGITPPGYEKNKAVVAMAEGAPPALRLEAAQYLHDRMHGKVKEEVDVSSTTREIKEVRVLVVGADPKQVGGAIDVLPATTTTH